MSSRNLQVLADVRDGIRKVKKYSQGVDRERFLADEMIQDAIVRALEIVSEASRSIAPAEKARYSKIDWKGVAGAGNIYRHQYGAVDFELVWGTIVSSEFAEFGRVVDELYQEEMEKSSSPPP